MSTAKLRKLLQKKTPSEKRMFFRLLNHFVFEDCKGNEIPPKIKTLIEQLSEPPCA